MIDAAAIERKVGGSGLPISTSLGVLRLNGLTAYFALLEIGQPKAGETAVVSTAVGAVGSCVGQIARIKGCRTVGIAGGLDKIRVCREEFRYDSAVDYRADDFESALNTACPQGVDVFFDNTAGPISDSISSPDRRLPLMKDQTPCGRVVGAWAETVTYIMRSQAPCRSRCWPGWPTYERIVTTVRPDISRHSTYHNIYYLHLILAV